MTMPNLISMFAGFGVILPIVLAIVSQQFPPEVYWWSAGITGLIGTILKSIEVWQKNQQPAQPQILPAPDGVSMAAAPAPAPRPSMLKAVLWQ